MAAWQTGRDSSANPVVHEVGQIGGKSSNIRERREYHQTYQTGNSIKEDLTLYCIPKGREFYYNFIIEGTNNFGGMNWNAPWRVIVETERASGTPTGR